MATTGARPAVTLVHGADGPVVVISGRVAAYLGKHAGLDEFRVDHRGRDAEVDEALVALRLVALAWRQTRSLGSVDTTVHTTQAQPDGESSYGLTTGQAAARLGVGAEAVRKAIREGRLPAEQIDGRWRITPEAIEHLKAARAA